MSEEARQDVFWGQRIVLLSALDRWNDAANAILERIADVEEAKQDTGAELHAYAAAALRRAGRAAEASDHDSWADKLALGSASLAIRIGNAYAYGGDYPRASQWWARSTCQAEPDSGEFALALKLHADALLEQGRWRECASISEVISRIYAASDLRWTNPLPFMRQRLQADTTRALANLKTRRADSLAILEKSHRTFASDGSLADFFFPAIRKMGLIREHDRWFRQSWNLMEAVIRRYPDSDNTCNTAAWFAARAARQLDAAEKLLTSALAANPDQPAYLDTMAEIHFARGNREKALEWSRRAVNFSPDDPQLRRQQERFRSDPFP
jgi:tetratricopeptide (TPR) repeat protein